jgi:hypothetical protein
LPAQRACFKDTRLIRDMQRQIEKRFAFVIAISLLFSFCFELHTASAAVGCSLSNPIQDIKYLFPEMTNYKEDLRDFSQMKDGRALYRALNERLGSDLDQLYEGYGTPYTVYTVFKGKEIIGFVHGVNVPGEGGLIQVILSMDPKSGSIRRLSFQRLESRASQFLRRKEFLNQFNELTLADFYKHDYYRIAEPSSAKDRIARIKNPAAGLKGEGDFDAAIRGVRKNLILLDFFVYNRRFEPFYQQTRARLAKRR